MRKRILITGGKGYIGKHLVQALQKKDYDILLYTEDIRKPVSEKWKADIIIHLAAKAKGDDQEIEETNVLGTKNILEACRQWKTKCIVTSSCGVYGNPAENPVNEEASVNPFNTYNRSKAEAEELCKNYEQQYSLKIIILRLFNIYGDNNPNEFLIRTLSTYDGKQPIKLNPNIIRDFIHVKDVIQAFLRAVEYEGPADIFNIGSGKGHTADQVIKIIRKITGRTIKYEMNKDPIVIKEIIADITKAKEKLKWSPKIGLEEGLKEIMGKKN